MLTVALIVLASCQPQPATPTPTPSPTPAPAQPEAETPAASVVQRLMQEAVGLRPLITSTTADSFLRFAEALPEPGPRTVYRTKDRSKAITAEAWAALPEEKKAEYAPRECTPEFYYYTGYGSPLVYARVVDLLAKHGLTDLQRTRVMDFGYGTIGHLRLLAECGVEAHGVEIEPMFEALYSREGDRTVSLKTGQSDRDNPLPGVHLHTGRWPADAELMKAVSARGAFDAVTSKNTLKKGYIHPEPPKGKTADERQLVKLGVDDAAYLKAVHDALRPGGLFLIYNIFPAQSPAEDLKKPYLPMADGRCPFTKEQFEAAGFDVLELDRDDQRWVLECWRVLGYDGGKKAEEAAKETFALYTAVRRR